MPRGIQQAQFGAADDTQVDLARRFEILTDEHFGAARAGVRHDEDEVSLRQRGGGQQQRNSVKRFLHVGFTSIRRSTEFASSLMPLIRILFGSRS